VCTIEGGSVRYSEDVLLPMAPMVGCIGTAVPGDAPQAGIPGRHGGNLDHPVVAEGTTVFLPVFAESGLLYIGDVHATQGDGELSGVAVEIPAEVTVTIDLRKGAGLRWPWAATDGAVMVMTADLGFGRAREEAVEAMMRVLESQLGLEPGDAIALMSVAGNLRIGQAFGAMEMTLRLEMPRSLGIVPA
jgi:acetamidase/formamidase